MLLLCTFKFHKSIIFRYHLSFVNVNLCDVDSKLESKKRCYINSLHFFYFLNCIFILRIMSINKEWFIINYIFRNPVVSFANNSNKTATKKYQTEFFITYWMLKLWPKRIGFHILLCQIQTKFLPCITCASSSSDSLEVSHGFLQMSRAQPPASSKDFVCTLAREAGWAEEQDRQNYTFFSHF